jgi:WD40 repeat protein
MTDPNEGGASTRVPAAPLAAWLPEDQRTRWRRGERVWVEAYLKQYPGLQSEPECLLDLIYQEVLLRAEQGETARLDEYLERFPQWAAQLKDQFEVHAALESEHLFAAPQPQDAPISFPPAPTGAPEEPATLAVPGDAVVPNPSQLGRFQIRRELGRGAFGRVFLAYDPQLARDVALKIPRAEALASPELRERFQREARAAAGLDHPNIVPVYEAGEVGSVAFIASAYCPGPSLAAWLKERSEPVPPRMAAAIVADLAEAMDHAHGRGVVHRDLKPSNVILSPAAAPADAEVPVPEGWGFVPRVTDFGLAKWLEGYAEAARATLPAQQTESGVILGTPSYMAPEQAGGQGRKVGPAADIYALGAVLYELLVGHPPFDADSVLAILEQVRTQEPVAPRRLRPRLPRDLETICLKCLRKEPPRRYATARDLADDLRRFLAGEPIRARPVSLWESGLRWARRHPALAALFVVLVLATIGTIGLLGALWRHAEARAEAVQKLDEAEQSLAKLQALIADRRGEVAKLEEEGRREQARTREAQQMLRRANYVADMRLAQFAAAGEDFTNCLLLLKRHLPPDPEPANPEAPDVRGFEWHYLWRLCHQERWVGPPEHTEAIRYLVFTGDGRSLLTVADDGNLKHWDRATGKNLPLPGGILAGPAGALGWFRRTREATQFLSLALSPDGTTLATGSTSGTVVLWDWGTGRPKLKPFQAHAGKVHGLAFAPDGQTLATTGEDKTAKLWDLKSGKEPATFSGHKAAVTKPKFTPDGRTLVTISFDQTARLWDVATGKFIREIAGEGGAWILDAAFTPNGKTLVTAEGYPWHPKAIGQVRFLDAATGAVRRSLAVPNRGAFAVAYAPDGKTLAVGTNQGTVLLVDAASTDVLHVYYGHTARVWALAFSPDGQSLASAGNDPTVRLWDVVARRARGVLWNPPVTQAPVILQQGRSWVNRVAVSPDGKTLATGFAGGTVHLFDLNSGHERLVLANQKAGYINDLAFSPDSRTLATAAGTIVTWWDATTGEELATFTAHDTAAHGVAFAPDGKTLASCGFDGTTKIWDLGNKGEPMILRNPRSAAVNWFQNWCLAYAPDGRTLAVGGGNRQVMSWDLATQQVRTTLFPVPAGAIFSVAFCADGKTLAAGTYDGWVGLWDAATGQEQAVFPSLSGSVNAVRFSPDGRTLAIAAGDGHVLLWDVPLRQERFRLIGHDNVVNALAFLPDGKRLVTGGQDGRVLLWDASPPGHSWPDPKPRPDLQAIDAEGFIRRWLILAPIPVEPNKPGAQGLAREQIPNEAKLAPREGDKVRVEGKDLVWRTHQTSDYYIDFVEFLERQVDFSVAYAVCYVIAETEMKDVQLRMGSDDQAKVYLNGQEVLASNVSRILFRDDNVATGLTLRRGVNVLVFKVVNEVRTWHGCVRFADRHGVFLRNLRVTLSPE